MIMGGKESMFEMHPVWCSGMDCSIPTDMDSTVSREAEKAENADGLHRLEGSERRINLPIQ